MSSEPALRLLAPLALAILAALSVVGAGALATFWFGRADPTSRSFAFRFTVGYPIFGTICFIVSLITINRVTAWALLGLFAIIAVAAIRHATIPRLRLSAPLFVVLAVALTLSVLMAQAPPFTLDEVAYHLAVPRLWVNEGRLVDLPLLTHSYFPFGAEAADIPFLTLLGGNGGVASHFLHLFGAIAVGMMIWDFIARKTKTKSPLAALGAIVGTPALLLTAGWSWNDWLLTGTCCAVVIALDELEIGLDSRPAYASAIAAGLLTKYTFALFAAVVVAIALLRSRDRVRLAVATLIGGGAGAIYFIRNLTARRNPFFPFFSDDVPAVAGYRDSGNIIETIASYVFDPKFVDETIGPALIFCALAFLLVRREGVSATARAAGVASFVVGCALLLLSPSSRILVPFFVVAAMVASAGFEKKDGKPRWVAAAVVWVAVGAQLGVAVLYALTLEPWRAFTDPAAFLSDRRRLQREIVAIDALLPPIGRTLVIGAQELFWFSKPVRGGGNFDGRVMARYLAADSPAALHAKLARDGFTHVAIFSSGVVVGEEPRDVKQRERVTTLPVGTARTLQRMLQRHADFVDERGNAAVFVLR